MFMEPRQFPEYTSYEQLISVLLKRNPPASTIVEQAYYFSLIDELRVLDIHVKRMAALEKHQKRNQ